MENSYFWAALHFKPSVNITWAVGYPETSDGGGGGGAKEREI